MVCAFFDYVAFVHDKNQIRVFYPSGKVWIKWWIPTVLQASTTASSGYPFGYGDFHAQKIFLACIFREFAEKTGQNSCKSPHVSGTREQNYMGVSRNIGDHHCPSIGGELGNFCYAKRGLFVPFLRSKTLKFPSYGGVPGGRGGSKSIIRGYYLVQPKIVYFSLRTLRLKFLPQRTQRASQRTQRNAQN